MLPHFAIDSVVNTTLSNSTLSHIYGRLALVVARLRLCPLATAGPGCELSSTRQVSLLRISLAATVRRKSPPLRGAVLPRRALPKRRAAGLP